ncbi:hypothetical protein [Streptomyces sp. NPDC014006]|uniref:hypothetical protein n=1 Tax=Streptomyces sp. NPDC014006 TaxID=3364870 RepID=UPI0036FBD3B4
MRTARALARHEARLMVSLLLWLARRRHGTRDATHAFGYARGQGATTAGLAFVCVVETFTLSVLLRDWPTAHAVALVLDAYTVVFVVALHAASVVRPHVLDGATLRVRHGTHVDLRIPRHGITAIRRELRASSARAPGELDVAVGGQTSLTLELARPVTHVTLLGRRREVRVVRLHADDADGLVRALTPARSSPSPSGDRPG